MFKKIILDGEETRWSVNEEGQVRNDETGKFLIGTILHTYRYINFRWNHKQKNKSVHRLVAEAFLPNPDNLPYVHHKDGNRLNNKLDNLEWVSAAENNKIKNKKSVQSFARDEMIKQTITIEEAQKRVDDVYGKNYLTILEYKGNNVKTNIRCEKCSNIFQSVPVSLWRHRVVGCPNCEKIKSLGESRVERYLRTHNIQFRTQERFLECKDKLCLPFDFYLPQLNVCIEFQGEQHYKEKSLLWSETLIKHDSIKKQFCKDAGIKLIEIPWYDIDNIEKYLGRLGRD